MSTETIKPDASPFTFTAPHDGRVILSAGGVQNVELSADGAEWLPLGARYGVFPLREGERLRVAYMTDDAHPEPPAMSFVA